MLTNYKVSSSPSLIPIHFHLCNLTLIFLNLIQLSLSAKSKPLPIIHLQSCRIIHQNQRNHQPLNLFFRSQSQGVTHLEFLSSRTTSTTLRITEVEEVKTKKKIENKRGSGQRIYLHHRLLHCISDLHS